MKNISRHTSFVALLLGALMLMTSCITVPALVTSDQYRAQYLGRPLTTLIDDHGLPSSTQALEDGGQISTWEMGTTSSSVGMYHGYGVSSGTSSAKAQRMTAYSDSRGIITDLRSSGYEMGNEDQVRAVKTTNVYLGVLYGSLIFSLLVLMSI
jgi:hypothetical protein